MTYIDDIKGFNPIDVKEKEDKKIILDFIEKYGESVLYRGNEIAHFTSSGFIMNKNLNKTIMVHHNIMNTWTWSGGHADGNKNFLEVSIKEAKEETGIKNIEVPFKEIISLDILPVHSHLKNNKYVSSHLHLSVAYLLIGDENEKLRIKEDENSGVKWISTEFITNKNFSENDTYLYTKIIKKAKMLKKYNILKTNKKFYK